MESNYLVVSQYNHHHIVRAKSPRKAVESACAKIGILHPKLFKIYNDYSINGKTYHSGYGCGNLWFSVGKIEWMENEVK